MARKPVTDMSAWPSLTLEGNLIAPAMVASIDRRQASEQTEEDYRIRKGLTIREEISTAFRVGQSHFDAFAKLENPSVETTRRFVRAFLEETFGFDDLTSADGVISFLAGGRVPIVVVPPSEEKLDRRSPTLSTDRSRSPAFALQDYLNDSDDSLWGLVTNGAVLRLMRDNASLTRPAYIEADLAAIFTNEDAASFAVLWSLIHRTRFGVAGTPMTDCALERWREAGSREGEAARNRLAAQVETALKVLGSGFLEANPDFAARVKSGEVNLTGLFNELLRLVYRLIFLMVAEDRNLLHPETAKPDARKLYAEGYSLAALRAQAVRAASWDKHHDRYEGIKVIFRALAHGQAALGLPALGGLFSADKLPHLETARLRNRAFMEALYRLSWLADKTGMMPVNWRAMETEELGSVYESLLELQPQLGDDGRSLVFASEAAEQKGNQRKTTGSYYTPDSLVQALLDSALDPVLDKTEAEAADPAQALLQLSVVDPACGSGHFLLAAARRIASRLARIRAEGNPSLADFRHALRDVARCCIYGVDRNPMAVELTKVALWIETVDPGLPLGFFDAQICCGDSLLGVFDLKVLEEGIPEAAYKPLTGDDKEVAKYYAQKNKRERAEKDRIAKGFGFDWARDLILDFEMLRAMPENTVMQIEAKAARLQALTAQGASAWQIETACDLYIAAFLQPKTKNGPQAGPDGMPRRGAETVPTSGTLWEWLRGVQPYGPLFGAAINSTRTAHAFHWPLEFPDVMQRGGFDVVLGNPPWERVKLQEEEFFALRNPEIATAKNAAARKKLIARLNETNPHLAQEWQDALRMAAMESHFMRESGRFPRGGVGDVNTYAVFTDHFWQLTKPTGYAGLIIPTGLVSGFTYRAFLADLLRTESLVAFYGFENEDLIFPHITNKVKFGLLTMAGRDVRVEQPWFTAHIRQPAEIADPEKRYALTIDEIRAINPNTLNLPAFRWSKDAEVTAAIHMAAPILIEKQNNTVQRNDWKVRFKRMFDMANDSGHFIDHEDVAPLIKERRGALAVLDDGRHIYPLYEGKMFWHFDHRYGTYEYQTEAQANKGVLPRVTEDQHLNPCYQIQPQYWIDGALTEAALSEEALHQWFFTWRDLGPSERSLVGTIIPRTAAGHKAPIMICDHSPEDRVILATVLSSLAVDYCVRQKTNAMTFFVVEQAAVLDRSLFSEQLAWLDGSASEWLLLRALELFYTNHELSALGKELGRGHPPFIWDSRRRSLIQAEIDALMLHLYALDRKQAEWVLDSFTVLRKYEERDYGEFRTKRLVLTAYEAMARAKELGAIYETPLTPLPGDPSLCHPIVNVGVAQISAALSDGVWARATQQPNDAGAALTAILKAVDRPTPTQTIRLAAAMMLEPHLLTLLLPEAQAREWRRLVGQEAEPRTGNVIGFAARTNQGWGAAVSNHRGNGRLIENLSAGTWAPGLGLDAFDTAGWPDGRAGFVLEGLAALDLDTTVTAMPDEVRDWITHAAAA